jgi:hypothetical protein
LSPDPHPSLRAGVSWVQRPGPGARECPGAACRTTETMETKVPLVVTFVTWVAWSPPEVTQKSLRPTLPPRRLSRTHPRRTQPR